VTSADPPGPAVRQLVSLTAPERLTRDRGPERRTVLGGLLLSAGFLLAAVIAWAIAGGGAVGWLPLHLALAGAAGTAIGTMLPHFLTSLAAAMPAPPGRRRLAIALLAGGVVTAAIGMQAAGTGVTVTGGLLYIGGLAMTAWNGFVPARVGLGRRGGVVDAAYGIALFNGAGAVGLAAWMLSGIGAASARWAHLKPAHAWLNLVGFVSLVIAATLIHLYPTVIGGRLRVHWTLPVIVVGLGVGAPLVAFGYAAEVDVAARLGGALVVASALALAIYAVRCRSGRGSWTTDLGWHRLAEGHFNAALAWFMVSVVALAWGPLWRGSDATGWSLAAIWGPLGVGWALQALVGAWTHLVPAIGPGDASRHALQRAWLARLGVPRLLAWNAGAAVLSLGAWSEAGPVALAGGLVVGATMLGSLILLGRSVLARSSSAGAEAAGV